MKRKILLIAVVVICVAIVAGGTLAYFTAHAEANNVITTGNVDIQVVEKWDNDGYQEAWEDVINALPGDTVSKIAMVENLGTADVWVRAQVTVAIDGSEYTLTQQYNQNTKTITLSYTTGSGPNRRTVTLVTITLNDGWTAVTTGGPNGSTYFYYDSSLAAGDTSTALFSAVNISTQMGDEYQDCDISINVHADAVQSANNGTSATTATGWPTN